MSSFLRHIAYSSSSTERGLFKCSTSSSSSRKLSSYRCKAASIAATASDETSSTSSSESATNEKKNDALVQTLTSNSDFSSLVEAVSRADMLNAFCEKKGLSREQMLTRENLADILSYHVIPSSAMSSEEVMSREELETLSAGKVLTTREVREANVSKADVSCGGVTVHVVDEVLTPVFSVPADMQSPQDILALSTDPTKPSGWAPEVLNGRVAMLGFVVALYGEITTGHGIAQQFGENFGEVLHTAFVWTLASFAPALSSNEGYTSNPKTMKDSRTWNFVFKGSPIPEFVQPVFTAEVEELNGRAAMVGCTALFLVELFKGSALF
ncbi:unnamed protein product [Bathycoccus prasinos]